MFSVHDVICLSRHEQVHLHCTILTNTLYNLNKYRLSPLYNLNKYIANILITYVKNENNSKNSTTVCSYIRNVPIEDDEVMVSFDVTSLYASIPIIDALNVIKDYVNNDDQFTRKRAIPQTSFMIYLVLTTTWDTFNSRFY